MTQTYDGGFAARKDKASAGMVTLGRQVKGSQFDTASRLKVCGTDVRARRSEVTDGGNISAFVTRSQYC